MIAEYKHSFSKNIKPIMKLSLFVGFVFISHVSYAQQLNYSEFSSRCERKTIVMNRESVKVAERLDGYCDGLLQGSFISLLHNKIVCFKEKEWPAGQFLLSLVTTYRQEKPQAPLGEVISDSFRRYFSCAS